MPLKPYLFLCLALSSLSGQPLVTWHGQATSPAGTPLKGVRITVQDQSGKSLASTLSGQSGAWTVEIPPGQYQVGAEATGYISWRLTSATAGQDLNVVLRTLVQEEAAVRYQPVVDAERTHQADFISDRQLQNLPMNRRDYLSLAALTPGVSPVNEYVGISDAPLAQAPQSGLSFGGNNGRGNERRGI